MSDTIGFTFADGMLLTSLGVFVIEDGEHIGWRCPDCTGTLTVDVASIAEPIAYHRAVALLVDAVAPHLARHQDDADAVVDA